MGWDEAIFGWMYAKARAVVRRGPSAEERAREARLDPLRDRLRIIASALAEDAIEIREAELEGGWKGTTLFLPARIAVAPTIEENVDAYLLRVAWSVAAMRSGLALDLDTGTSPGIRTLATALAAPGTRDAMLDACPSIEARWSALERHVLAARPRTDGAPALDRLIRLRLGDTEALAGASSRDRSWLERALRAVPRDRGALEGAVRALAPELAALGREPVPIPIAWGAIGAPDDAAAGASGPHGAEALPSGTELRGRAREQLRRVELPDENVQDNPLVHSFEKVHTAEEHKGGSKTRDGSDELEDHAAALDELDLREVIRSSERTSSLLRCDAMLEGTAGDLEDGEPDGLGIPYDEWNEDERRYRAGWCRVRPSRVTPRVSDADARATVTAMRRRTQRRVDAIRAELARLEHSRRWRARQLDGPEIDDDAVVERLATVASGHSGPERLYRARRRHAPELAVLLLLDASLSTDGWVCDRRVLDVELESALAIAEALEGADVELGLATFHSHTRRDCRFTVLKGLTERWDAVAHRLASVEPAGYTRMGSAVRHATSVLERTSARRRLLLLLTDGKPNDYDRYEGRYGVADVRQAIREADVVGVHTHALAFDREARFHLPRMFGRSRYEVVPDPDHVPLALARVCADMTR